MTDQEAAISNVLRAIETVKAGGMVIMVDDEDRENEGDLVFAASHVTPEKINFMTKEARGLICLSLEQIDIDRLQLPMMEDAFKKGNGRSTAFTVSIEARTGVTTGISAHDRSRTIEVAVDDRSTAEDIVVPGHIFPLKARSGGVLERAGHTEGSVDLARLAGCKAAGVICEIMNSDGTMARFADLEKFSSHHDIPIVTIADLVTFRLFKESLIEELGQGDIATTTGIFKGSLFRNKVDGLTHFALLKGECFEDQIVDVRVHRQRPLVDVFGHGQADSKIRVEHGLRMLRDSTHGVFLYLCQSDPQGGLEDEVRELCSLTSDNPSDKLGRSVRSPSPRNGQTMDSRMLGVGAQILRHLGVRKMRVHMSNPAPLKGLVGFDLEVVETYEIRPETSQG